MNVVKKILILRSDIYDKVQGILEGKFPELPNDQLYSFTADGYHLLGRVEVDLNVFKQGDAGYIEPALMINGEVRCFGKTTNIIDTEFTFGDEDNEYVVQMIRGTGMDIDNQFFQINLDRINPIEKYVF